MKAMWTLLVVCMAACVGNASQGEGVDDTGDPEDLAGWSFPSIKVTPGVIDFGQVFEGEEPEETLNILNLGDAELELTGFQLSGCQFFSLVVAGTEYPVSQETVEGITLEQVIELEPNESLFFKVRFVPEDNQKAEGTLTLYSNDPLHPQVSVQLRGNQSGPCMAVNPQEVTFGGREIGAVATLPMVISSCGDEPLEIYGIAFMDGSSEDFWVDLSPLVHEPAAATPLVISPGDDVTIYVHFMPDEENPTDVNGNPIPDEGSVFISVCDQDKEEIVALARELHDLGYRLFATLGTATVLRDAGIKANAIFRISKGRPNILDMIADGEAGWIINTPSGASPRADEVRMRGDAVIHGIPITTTVSGVRAALQGIRARRRLETMEVCSLQEFHRHTAFKLGGGN